MIDLAQIRERVAAGHLSDTTRVDLGMLAQIADEIEAGRKAQRELQQLQARQGKHFGRRSLR